MKHKPGTRYRIVLRRTKPKDEKLYWSNQDGWVESKGATVFTAAERKRYGLPINGEWEAV